MKKPKTQKKRKTAKTPSARITEADLEYVMQFQNEMFTALDSVCRATWNVINTLVAANAAPGRWLNEDYHLVRKALQRMNDIRWKKLQQDEKRA